MDNFVVYAYVRSGPDRFGRMGTFYYIGKGRPGRPFQCSKGSRHIKCPRDRKNNILILHSNLDEQTAFEYEKRLIQFYGRIDTTNFGVLRNLTDGGDGSSGVIFSKERRKRISERFKGEGNPMYGKIGKLPPAYGLKRSEECKKKLSEARKGPNNPMYGKTGPQHNRYKIPHTPETINKLSLHFDWYHQDYGEVLNTSTSALVRMFPEQKLDRSALVKVSLGKANRHKNWILLKNKKSRHC